jgi:hypothetical protein
MAFNFTHAAFLDKQLEDLAIVLENRLVGGRFWLPSRQQIEIRRTGTWMEFPVRGIIRGWWEIGDYEFNLSIPQQVFAGPEITFATPAEIRSYPWAGKITDSLPPDVLMTVDPDIQKVQAEARALVQERALERVQGVRLSGRQASDFVRFNRIEGLSIGAGSAERIGGSAVFTNRIRFGFSDHELKGAAELRQEYAGGSAFAFASRDLVDIGDYQERSGAFNSIGAQEFGNDLADSFKRTSVGLGVRNRSFLRAFDATYRVAFETDRQSSVNAVPASGNFVAAPQISDVSGVRATLDLSRPSVPFLGGILRLWVGGTVLDGRNSADTWYRVHARAEQNFSLGRAGLNLSGFVAQELSDFAPLQELVYFGGPVSLPGYDLHDVAGKGGLAGRAEGSMPIPFLPIPLGRFGHVPAEAHLAPYVAGAYVHGFPACAPSTGRCPTKTDGFYPSAGIGLLTFFDLLRFDVARGFRDGRWMFNVDVNRSFWSIL